MACEPEFRHFRALGAWLQAPLSTLLHETAAVRYLEQKTLPFPQRSRTAFFFHLAGDDVPAAAFLGFEFERTLFFALLDRLQGGDGMPEEEADCSRPLTRLETRLAARFLLLFQNAIRETWNLPEPFDFEPVSGEELNPGRNVSALEFQLDFGNCGGKFRILRPMMLRRRVASLPVPDSEEVEAAFGIAESLADTPVRISVQLSGEKIRPQDLMRWRVGDVISLGRPEDFPFGVLIEGVEKFSAAPGRFKSRKAFRIL